MTPADTEPRPRPRHAIVLAAGEGSRLRPLTERYPKPMLPIDGEAVVLRVLRQLAAVGVEQATVVVGYRGDQLRCFLERGGQASMPTLAFVEQEQRLGSGHALQRALAGGAPHVDSLIVASDNAWRDDDVEAIVDASTHDTAIATMALVRLPVSSLPHALEVAADDELRVRRVLHDPGPASDPHATALSGTPCYVVREEFWRYVETAPAAGGVVELATALQQAIDDGHVVRGHEFSDARDLTSPQDLLELNFPYLPGTG